MMSLRCQCTNCGATYKVADASAGKRTKCAKCATVFVVEPIADDPVAIARPTPVSRPATSDSQSSGIEIGVSRRSSSGAYRVPPKKSSLPLLAGGGILLAAVAAGGAYFAMNQPPPPKKKPAVAKKDVEKATESKTAAAESKKKEPPAATTPTATAARATPKVDNKPKVDNTPTPFVLPPEQPAEAEPASAP